MYAACPHVSLEIFEVTPFVMVIVAGRHILMMDFKNLVM